MKQFADCLQKQNFQPIQNNLVSLWSVLWESIVLQWTVIFTLLVWIFSNWFNVENCQERIYRSGKGHLVVWLSIHRAGVYPLVDGINSPTFSKTRRRISITVRLPLHSCYGHIKSGSNGYYTEISNWTTWVIGHGILINGNGELILRYVKTQKQTYAYIENNELGAAPPLFDRSPTDKAP